MAGGARAFTAVLTRPDGQSAGLAAQLADAGCDVLEFPLIDIAPVDDPAPLAAAFAALADYALVIFVSPNAIDRALAQYGAIWPNALPVGVVGPGSVAALERHGIAPPAYRVIAPQPGSDGSAPHYDSEGLFASIEAAFGGAAALAGKRVLIVRGDGGREWLADRLREAGADVMLVAAYRRVVPEPRIGMWERVHALLGGEPHAWLVTSSEGVRNLHELARAHLNDTEIEALKHAPLVTPHPRIEQTARALGFDRITLTGAGDERIVRAFRTMADEAVQPATAAPVTKRMTDTNDSKSVASQPAAASVPPSQPSYTASEPPARRGGSAVLWFVVVVLGCAAGVGGYALNRKIDRLDDALVARQKTLDAQVAETRTKTEQALASTHQVDTQLAQLDGKLADAQSAQQALQQQYQDLSRNRDAWMLEEVDQMLSSASQQLQLTGNTQLALIALQNADARLATSQSAQAVTVRKALAQDIEKLKAAPSADLTGLAIKLDDAIARIDALPLSGEAIVPHAAPKVAPADTASAAAAGEPRWKTWWHDFSSGLTQQLKGLVQVRRIDNADAMLASPDQGYFVRENVKLRLLAARLSLLARNESAMKADLHAAQASVGKYFDQASKDTQTVEDLLKQVDGASLTVAVPNLNTSLNAVQQFKSRG
ncbi:fused uroporphyrinogen-III synthase HemD/membrane protein HemX [Burkholderia multivorans]|nr:fused uroporphyrinogen-III synthase HemD/membrane protein HemX [Burkholderia multivorans]